jgi:hypothetical protein
VTVRLGLFDESYIKHREFDSFSLDLVLGGEVEVTVEYVVEEEHDSQARALAREVATQLASGELEPTAGSVEHIALTIPG